MKADTGLSNANFVLRFSVQDPHIPRYFFSLFSFRLFFYNLFIIYFFFITAVGWNTIPVQTLRRWWYLSSHITTLTSSYLLLTSALFLLIYQKHMEVGIDAEKTEFIFVVDRSGSMSGYPWQACAAALQIFLRSIPPGINKQKKKPKNKTKQQNLTNNIWAGCYFQVVGFGTQYETIFEESKQYVDSSLTFASSVVASWSASLGGTQVCYLWFSFLLFPSLPSLLFFFLGWYCN